MDILKVKVNGQWVGIPSIKGEKGDSDLPEVTSSDNGKILRVVNGEWSAVTLDNANGVSF